jgi:hypothetical protein
MGAVKYLLKDDVWTDIGIDLRAKMGSLANQSIRYRTQTMESRKSEHRIESDDGPETTSDASGARMDMYSYML